MLFSIFNPSIKDKAGLFLKAELLDNSRNVDKLDLSLHIEILADDSQLFETAKADFLCGSKFNKAMCDIYVDVDIPGLTFTYVRVSVQAKPSDFVRSEDVFLFFPLRRRLSLSQDPEYSSLINMEDDA